ncbi:MAG: [Fe-Fe] hydrogenase large subunit C-terminal domain-containing protein, partial [Chthoniobacter sp.]|nr:[Fe-Fe] hydrogenase large subunit C-terminal domain-containing protein [Chthoniobacter sp.]
VVSLAPSFAAQYPGIRPGQLVHALKKLGFFAVSETALGAQQVSASILALMRQEPNKIWISSTCPSVVDFIRKYHPESLPHLCGVLSPLLAHCKMLRAQYGSDIAVVSIGPCISEKKEAEQHPELLDVALTFEDLDFWLNEKHLNLAEIVDSPDDHFEPEPAQEGALFPIEGGMASSLTGSHSIENLEFISVSGIPDVEQALKDIQQWQPEHSIFFEMSACAGSCINGPKAARSTSLARRRHDVVQYAKPATELPRQPSINIAQNYVPAPVAHSEYGNLQLSEALRTVGKHSVDDELNCGGCGYDTCRDFARALISRNAERMMCATYTRTLAQKKANALLQKMPSAVVIVDDELNIIECNANFVRLFAPDEEPSKTLEGRALSAVMPFSYLFHRVLDSSEDIVGHDIRYQRGILTTSIFAIEPHSVLCGIFRDISEPIFQKEQIIDRAREVIQKNLKTVQQIAYLLGENAADSEIILNSIVRSFTPKDVDDDSAGDQP